MIRAMSFFCVRADKYRDGQVVLSKLEPEKTNSDTGKNIEPKNTVIRAKGNFASTHT